MSAHNNGRKAPNVSQYLANLNAIPSTHDVATQEENFDIDEQLAQFTNVEFLDFDTGGEFLENPVPDFNSDHGARSRRQSAETTTVDSKGMDFVNNTFNFDMNAFHLDQSSTIAPPTQNPYITTGASRTHPASLYTPPTSTSPPTAFKPAPYPGQKHPRSPSSAASPTGTHSQEPETAASRLAAEEDKRRRNTAASARFRVKKKQREQALEQTAKELETKVVGLEQRISQLETENEWLRGLVVDKNGGEKEDLRIRWKSIGASKEESDERKGGEGKTGVGTEEETKA